MAQKEVKTRPVTLDSWLKAYDRFIINAIRARNGLGPLGQERAKTWTRLRKSHHVEPEKADQEITRELGLDEMAKQMAPREAKARYN